MVDAKAAASPGPNLGVIPDAWGEYTKYGRIKYGNDPQICFLDNTVVRTAGKPSIRLDPHTSADANTAREVNGKWYAVKPGDHIVAKCWMKLTASGKIPPDTNPYSGARIGIDFYDSSIIPFYTFWSNFYGGDFSKSYVHWGSDWTQKIIDIIVPAKDVATGRVPGSFVLWMQVWSSTYGGTDPGMAWFADAELYINPNFTSTAPPPLPQNVTNGQKWARTWYVYSGNSGSPWSQVLGSGPDESNLNFDNNWGSKAVAYSRSDRIGFVSTRTVNLSAGSWTFTVGGDDGVRLYVDDKLVINGWKDQAYTTYTYKTSFSSTADHSLRLEWYEYTGNARASFSLKQG